ncbi:MAG TPA: NAD(P)-binding domain-containing protein [Streptosporangiaceae bacterium]|nr:NAD(P)-binding domain-containing protein [Streptosporangiaceae bacterium]
MSNISIIGTGNMARILGTRAVAGGNTVEVTGRDAAKAAALASELGGGATTGTFGSRPAGDIVILAVLYASAAPVVGLYGEALADKVIVDISNAFDPAGTGLLTPEGSSAAEETARAAPASAHVVKAFNTNFGHVLAADKPGGRPLDVFIAGDDAEAKARVSSFIESLALRPLDVGDLKMAHWLEGAGLLMVAPLVGKAVGDSNFWLGINTLG